MKIILLKTMNFDILIRVIIVLTFLAFLVFIVIAVAPPSKTKKKNYGDTRNKNILDYGSSETGYFPDVICSYIEPCDGVLTDSTSKCCKCELGKYRSDLEVNKCDRYYHTPDYLAVGDLSLDSYNVEVINTVTDKEAFFSDQGLTTVKDLCNQDSNAIGFYYNFATKEATIFKKLTIGSIPLEHYNDKQAFIYLKKSKTNSIIHGEAIFFYDNNEYTKWWEEKVRPGRTVFRPKTRNYIILNKKPSIVINKTTYSLVYYKEPISDINNPPADTVTDLSNVPLLWSIIYVYAK